MKYPNLRHVRAFVEVARRRSFVAAAQALHMTQSAVSQAVARLEEQIGVQLLDRSNRAPAPADQGRRSVPAGRVCPSLCLGGPAGGCGVCPAHP
ncbi:MAG: LysR family transcriptional regulator [Lautropia sp.]